MHGGPNCVSEHGSAYQILVLAGTAGIMAPPASTRISARLNHVFRDTFHARMLASMLIFPVAFCILCVVCNIIGSTLGPFTRILSCGRARSVQRAPPLWVPPARHPQPQPSCPRRPTPPWRRQIRYLLVYSRLSAYYYTRLSGIMRNKARVE